ncbi:tonB-dependent Receptor Plug domain protein, partial [Yersinia pestis PY-10]
MGIIEW